MTQQSARDLAERLADHLLGGTGTAEIADFLETEVKGLALIRDPREDDLPVEPLRATLRYWQGLPRIEGIPNAADLDPGALRPVLGYLMLIDIDGETDDFRYTLYGSKISRISGFDMTGKSVWQVPTTSSIQSFFAAGYLAARKLKRPIYTVHDAPLSITAGQWHRLILPLGLEGEITRFLVCNLPVFRGEIL